MNDVEIAKLQLKNIELKNEIWKLKNEFKMMIFKLQIRVSNLETESKTRKLMEISEFLGE